MAKNSLGGQEPQGASLASYIILGACVLVLLLHLFAALHPLHENWGVHFFALYGVSFALGNSVLLLLCLLPRSQKQILHWLEIFFSKCSNLPIGTIILIVGGAVLIAGNLFAPGLHLLGDGIILLRSLSSAEWGTNIIHSFNNQPLMYVLFRTALNVHLINSSANAYDLYVWIDRAGGIMFLSVIVWLMRSMRIPPLEKVFLGGFLFVGAGSQFFFGYVENYVFQYVFTAIYVVSGWFAIEKRISIFVPIICFHVIVGLHLGNLVFLPSLLLLLYACNKDRKHRGLLFLGGIAAVDLLATFWLGFLPSLVRHFTSESVDFLQPFTASGGNYPYPMFSVSHLLDWLNLNLLVVPLGLIVILAFVATSARRQFRENAVLPFLFTAAACGLLFTWVVNTALGMARDWDLLSGFLVPLMILCVYLIAYSLELRPRRYTLSAVVIISLLHWSSWIGTNADVDRHLRRAELLNSPRFLSLSAQLFHDESLANYFYDGGKYPEARMYYEHFIQIDSGNPRIIANISDVYRKLGEKDRYFSMLKRAVELKSREPGIYANLGVEYAGRGDTMLAIRYNEEAVALDPRQEKAHANLGILYASKGEYELAIRHLGSAIELGLTDPLVFKYAAELSLLLKDYTSALQYFDMYLAMNPGDQASRASRERAQTLAKSDTSR